jgi:integrase
MSHSNASRQSTGRLGSDAEQCLKDFDEHLDRVKGLSLGTRKTYCLWTRRFLANFCGTDSPDWLSLRGENLAAFIRRETPRLKGHGRDVPRVAIRAFLRFLCFSGRIHDELPGAIPRRPRWRHTEMPQHLPPEAIERVIAGAMDGTAKGRRNYAILLLLARTGMRAHEVAQLALDDIDWTQATISIRSKKSRAERRIPLSDDVGAALVEYLQNGRPPCETRAVFLRAVPPIRPFLGSVAICRIARRALVIAGVARSRGAAHVFRHTAATCMVTGGASFKEIADVLGHASIRTTAIYAKLDLASLYRVAMPWPGSTP